MISHPKDRSRHDPDYPDNHCFGHGDIFYASLGFGDVLPNAQLRFLASIEALNGLLLIARSASFMFAAMNRSWHCFSGKGLDDPPT